MSNKENDASLIKLDFTHALQKSPKQKLFVPQKEHTQDLDEFETLHDLEQEFEADNFDECTKYEIISTESPDIISRGRTASSRKVTSRNFVFGAPLAEDEALTSFNKPTVTATRKLNFDDEDFEFPSPAVKKQAAKKSLKFSETPTKLRHEKSDSSIGSMSQSPIAKTGLYTTESTTSMESGFISELEEPFLEIEESNSPKVANFSELLFGQIKSNVITEKSFLRRPLNRILSFNPESRARVSLFSVLENPNLMQRNKKTVERSENEVANKRRSNCDSPEVERLQRPVLQRAFSENNALIMSALARSMVEPDLIGDFSVPYALPLTDSDHSDLKSISCDTLTAPLRGDYKHVISDFMLDFTHALQKSPKQKLFVPQKEHTQDLDEFETLHDLEQEFEADNFDECTKYEIISTESPDIISRGRTASSRKVTSRNFVFGAPLAEDEALTSFNKPTVTATRKLNFDDEDFEFPSPAVKKQAAKKSLKFSETPTKLRHEKSDSSIGSMSQSPIAKTGLYTTESTTSMESGFISELEEPFLEIEESNSPKVANFSELLFGQIKSNVITEKSFLRRPLNRILSFNPESRARVSLFSVLENPNLMQRNKKTVERSENEVANKRRSNCDSPEVERLQRPVLQRAFSENNALIMSALARSMVEPDLIGDFSVPYALPLTDSDHSDLKSISCDTLTAPLRGDYKHVISDFMLDFTHALQKSPKQKLFVPQKEHTQDLDEFETLHDLEQEFEADNFDECTKYEIISTESPDIISRGRTASSRKVTSRNFVFGAPLAEDEALTSFNKPTVTATRKLNFDDEDFEFPSPAVKKQAAKKSLKFSETPTKLRHEKSDSSIGSMSQSPIAKTGLYTTESTTSMESGFISELEEPFLEIEESNSPKVANFSELLFGQIKSNVITEKSFLRRPLNRILSFNPESRARVSLFSVLENPNLMQRNKKTVERSENEVANKRRSNCDSPEVERLQRPVLQRAFSENNALIMSALARSMVEPDLIGDFSVPYALPLTDSDHSDLKSISCDTLTALLRGDYKHVISDFMVIDCRYPYEYEGGHIAGAVNYYTTSQIHALVDEPPREPPGRSILVFHCEFSLERGPKLCRALRARDRARHVDRYPALRHPELYVLRGGYRAFHARGGLGAPPGYTRMRDPAAAALYRAHRDLA